jgi:predicted PurR-regulated permease PerM
MQKVEISHRTIVFTVLFLIGLWFLWSIKGVILEILIAVILMTAFNPLVNKLEKTRIFKIGFSRIWAIIIVYTVLLLSISLFIILITQPLVNQTANLVKQLPYIFKEIQNLGIDQSVIERQLSQLNTLPADIFKLITGIFSNLISVFTTLIMSLYLLLEREKLHKYLAGLLGNFTIEKKTAAFIDELEFNLGGWVRAEAILMLIVGLLTYIGLFLLGVPYALPLAIMAGILELLPNVGPTIASVPAIIISLTISPLTTIGVLALYIMIQLFENNFIVPQIMSKTLGVNPLVTIISLLIGFSLGGIKGAILAVPTVLLIKIILRHFIDGRWLENKT